ncbi:serine/threonine protein kinase [Candidatus Woesearchaeota archaeon]|nr:serine/threonine protein kinase [Candidatus Woesearchaeota archaeon]
MSDSNVLVPQGNGKNPVLVTIPEEVSSAYAFQQLNPDFSLTATDQPHKLGGMAAVFLAVPSSKATAPSLEDLVALKVFSPHFMDDEKIIEEGRIRASKEMHLLAALDHPRIIKPLSEDGAEHPTTPYGVMPFFRFTLNDVIYTPLREHLSLTTEHVRNIALSLLDAELYLESKHIIHRDIKPANILFNGIFGLAEGDLWLADFGIMKNLGSRQDDTDSGRFPVDLSASAFYASPEYIARRGGVSRSDDLFGIGATLYELIVGERLKQKSPNYEPQETQMPFSNFKAHNHINYTKAKAKLWKQLDKITPPLLYAIMGAINPEPYRYPSVEQFYHDVNNVQFTLTPPKVFHVFRKQSPRDTTFRLDESLFLYNNARELPEQFLSYLERGIRYLHEQKYHDAKSLVVDAIALQPEEPYPHEVLGDIFAGQGKAEAAFQSYATSAEKMLAARETTSVSYRQLQPKLRTMMPDYFAHLRGLIRNLSAEELEQEEHMDDHLKTLESFLRGMDLLTTTTHRTYQLFAGSRTETYQDALENLNQLWNIKKSGYVFKEKVA